VVESGGQFVLLGTGHADGGLRKLAYDVFGTDHPHVRMVFGYSESLAHQIYAAADMMLVPSMFEPCGLTQMIALRYGTVPVVRSTGGLADTVVDAEEGSDERQGGAPAPNGFVFHGVDAGSLDGALDRAMDMYLERKDEWEQLQCNNLINGERWSWTVPAESYLSLYVGVLS
jgi:starch synthase